MLRNVTNKLPRTMLKSLMYRGTDKFETPVRTCSANTKRLMKTEDNKLCQYKSQNYGV